jgi:hypothetical protein
MTDLLKTQSAMIWTFQTSLFALVYRFYSIELLLLGHVLIIVKRNRLVVFNGDVFVGIDKIEFNVLISLRFFIKTFRGLHYTLTGRLYLYSSIGWHILNL